MGKCKIKLIMLNNKASIDAGSGFFYSISNKTKVILKSYYMHVLETVIVIVIDTEFSRTFYKYSI
jgi:hypothetical protein